MFIGKHVDTRPDRDTAFRHNINRHSLIFMPLKLIEYMPVVPAARAKRPTHFGYSCRACWKMVYRTVEKDLATTKCVTGT